MLGGLDREVLARISSNFRRPRKPTMASPRTRFSDVASTSIAKLFAALFTTMMMSGVSSAAGSAVDKPLHVLLIGASIGQDWNLPDLPKRTGLEHFEFEAKQVWQYDKTSAVDEALLRPGRKFQPTLGYLKGFFRPAPTPPDVFILKECSSYFPSDLAHDRELLQRWVAQIRGAGRPLILATTVPVTESRSRQDTGKQRGVREFNDWLRNYAKEQGIPLMDLEAALRTDDTRRFLRDEYTSGDGSHLNRQAYQVLDRVLVSTLCGALGKPGACAVQTALRQP